MNFDQAFERLTGHEDGLSWIQKIRGTGPGAGPVGELKGTKYGIAANTYPDVDIKNLTLEQAKAIYPRDWWIKAGCDQYDGAIAFQLWDFAVNASMETAKRALQRAVKVADDGQIGPKTVLAIKAMTVTDVLMRFNAQRLKHYTSLSTWSTYGKGWTNRVAANLDYAAEDA